jgi:hypothetical protein
MGCFHKVVVLNNKCPLGLGGPLVLQVGLCLRQSSAAALNAVCQNAPLGGAGKTALSEASAGAGPPPLDGALRATFQNPAQTSSTALRFISSLTSM